MHDIKGQLLAGAMKLMQTDGAKKMMASPQFQNAMAYAFRTTYKVRTDMENTKKRMASTLNLVTRDELRELRRNVERLERRVRKAEKKTKSE